MMILAAVCTAMLLGVLALLCAPLLFRGRPLPDSSRYDSAVYRHQLGEVDSDVERGELSPAEADAARLEIQRRLLAVPSPPTAHATSGRRSPVLAAGLTLFLLVGVGGLYARLGSPDLPDAPLRTRQAAQAAAPAADPAEAAAHVDMKDAADRLEGRLRTDPSNADNWLLLARTTSMLGDWDKAADAYRQALRLGRKGADVYAALGEMLVLAAEGIVSPAAHDAFASAITTNPANDVARFYQALADSQAGDVRKAIDAWLALARDSPSDSPMREEIARQVAEAARSGGFEAPKLPPGRAAAAADDTQAGPTQDQMAAAAQMPPAERDKMIDGMIAQLAARLEAQPADADGWLRLGNAYAVRGKADKANDALERAIRLKPADPDVKLRAATSLLSGLQPSDPLPPRAIALLHDVAAARPDTPEALWYLGVAAAREGHPDAARLGWSRLLGLLAKDGEDAKMVQSALAQLKAP